MSSITAGWLKKETHGPLKRYEKRWVVVSGNSLSYFRKDDSSAPLGVIDLPGKKIIKGEEDRDNSFKFELTDKDGSFMFMCDSKSEREKWMDAISCISYAPYGGGMFGTTIETSVKRERVHGGGSIPKVISQCIGYLDVDFRLRESGIFRLPGNEKLVKSLKSEFQEGLEPNLDTKADTHTVASLLKLYLRTLSDSLIPAKYYEDFLSVIWTYDINPQEGIQELKFHFNKIPVPNYNTLRMLCRFLYKVQSYSDYNRMDLNNLAIVFAPTILKNNSGDISLEMSDMTKLKKVVEIMFMQHEYVFPKDKEMESQNIDMDNIDPDTLKNLYSVLTIKHEVLQREMEVKEDEIQKKDNEITSLKQKLDETEERYRLLLEKLSNLEVQQLEGVSSNNCNTVLLQSHVEATVSPELPPPPLHQEVVPVPPRRGTSTKLSSPVIRRSSPVKNVRPPPVKPRPRTIATDPRYNAS